MNLRGPRTLGKLLFQLSFRLLNIHFQVLNLLCQLHGELVGYAYETVQLTSSDFC